MLFIKFNQNDRMYGDVNLRHVSERSKTFVSEILKRMQCFETCFAI